MSKTALVTGGGRGIGKACSLILAQNGYNVVVNYNKNERAANDTVDEIVKSGGNAVCMQADVSDQNAVNNMAQNALKTFGKIDCLVNNAGVAASGLFIDSDSNLYNKIFDINMRGVYNCTHTLLPHMLSRKSGSIINISSIWGQTGGSCEVIYSAAKAAVIGFTKALAKETGLSNVRVNCICPGVIDTEMLNGLSDNDKRELIEQTPLHRLGNAHDIAKAVLFLAGDNADFITGQIIAVNGGLYI
jgi:3-oxoacyl-[acyl-carrier protein] reductase